MKLIPRHKTGPKLTRMFDGKTYHWADVGSKDWMEQLAEGFRQRGVKARLVPDSAVRGDYRLYISENPNKFRGKGGAPKYNVNPFGKWKNPK